MRSSTLLTTLAAASTAHGFGFRNAGSFDCPSNTDNQCTEQQSGGFDFNDLPTGGFSSYKDMSWKGFSCGKGFDKRESRFDTLERRTFGSGNFISGVCGSDKGSSPSFGCNPSKKFSIGEFHVAPEFDCDLEFHYDMPDGSTCKHRDFCPAKGKKVKNTQCGGATNVTIVYPPQPQKPKPSCTVSIPSISFSCGQSSTKPPTTKPTPPTTKPTPPTTQTSEIPKTTPTIASSTSTTKGVESSPPVQTSPSVKTTPPVQTPPVQTTEATSSMTTYFSTSTIFTTITSTVTSCAESVSNCPTHGNGTHIKTTIVTVPVSTTICPVTETVSPTKTKTPETLPPVKSSSAVTPPGPVETLPCPDVVPKCLNTWLFSLSCADNTDHACYCPDTLFVENIFTCLYAHGESDTIISQAVVFFQGLCAPYVPSNPAIATGATCTTYITPTATATIPAVYTTVTVQQTTVVPCTDEAGSTIPSSSSTVVISTAMTVPQVGFATNSGTVGVVPVTTPIVVAKPTTATTAKPIGTGKFTPTGPPATVVTAAAGRVSGLGLGGLAAIAAVVAVL